MAVTALELRPRNAVALFDAAVRLCATSAGVWALTLPAGAALVAGLFHLAEAVQRHRPLVAPAALFTLAWVFRAVSQGAACHYLDEQLLSKDEPSVRRSLRAGLYRLPSLVIAAATCAVLDAVLLVLTAGLGLLFVGAHQAAYAATMRGQGHPLALYATCSKLLGAARHSAPWVRLCGASQLLLAVNLHLGAALGLTLASKLIGLDVTFLDRFASLDNGVWLVTVAATTFALFEPVRAATATLLLVDGRVRQEGLDLVAAVEQLPLRRKPRMPGLVAALALLLPVAVVAWPAPARADGHTAARDRLARLVDECELEGRVTPAALDDVDALDAKDTSALNRLVAHVERLAFDEEDCDAAEEALVAGLGQVHALRAQEGVVSAQRSRDEAKAILGRPEFQDVPEAAPEEAKPDEAHGPSWWDQFMEWLYALLKRLFEREHQAAPDLPSGGGLSGPMAGANAVIVGAIVLVLAVLVGLLVRSLGKKPSEAQDTEAVGLEQSPLTADPMSALSRPPETWAGLADELAARGEFREATRHLYLALLSRLHRDGAIDYDATRSNWDYLVGFKGGGDSKGRFRELTRRFDFAWYGHLEVGPPDYRDFRSIAEPMLAPPTGAPAHA